jgi:hypothetical protein
MAYVTAEAQRELLETVAEAVEQLASALASLGVAYELLDEHNADVLEAQLFRPVQVAYGRMKRTHDGFAGRVRQPGRTFGAGAPASASGGVRGLLDSAVDAVGEADLILSTLQDSMQPVEVGDAELRSGLAQVRELVGPLPTEARELVRTLGR